MKRIVIGFFLLSLIVANAWAQFAPFDEIKKFDGRFVNEVNLADSLLNYGVRPKLNAKTWFNLRPVVGVTDTAFSIRSSAGNTVVWADTTGKFVAKVAVADTFKANYAVLWGPNLADYTVVATDSVASAGAASDTTGTRVYWRRYFSWDSATSPSMKTGIYSTVFVPGGSLNPDSLVVNLWFDGTHANTDSGAAMIVVKGQAGTIVSTGWVTVAAASTWEHKGYVMATPFTRNEEYEILVYTKSVSGGRWCWSPPRFK